MSTHFSGGGSIKSTQTVVYTVGTLSGTWTGYTFTVTLGSSVNLQKCLFLVNGETVMNSGGSVYPACHYYVSSTGTTITLGYRAGLSGDTTLSAGGGSLQVIEFI